MPDASRKFRSSYRITLAMITTAFALLMLQQSVGAQQATPTSTPPALTEAATSETPVLIPLETLTEVTVYAGPGTDYPVVTTLKAGTQLSITGLSDNYVWFVVSLPDGSVGWV